MATINHGILSDLRGSIGKITGRVRNGKNILSLRPTKVKTSQQPESVTRRTKFKLAVQLSKAIYSDQFLKKLWGSLKSDGIIPFNLITKTNYQTIVGENFSNRTTITPSQGFKLSSEGVEISNDSLSISFVPLKRVFSFNTAIEVKIKPIVIAYFANQATGEIKETLFYNFDIATIPMSVDDAITINVSLNETQSSYFSGYGEHAIFTALLTLDENDNIINYSETVYSA
ncbi:MAG: hypothetical protein KF721_09310 [Ignavibacteriaceae bacterium]|nr:hypothetical protein [Ignavibacteriaceae bacterium]